eukprot:scaffold13633_cov64-Phaeocystis_antarctica.AAC.8
MLGRQAFWTTTVSSPIEDAITVSGPVTAACGNDGTALNVSTFRSHIKAKWGEERCVTEAEQICRCSSKERTENEDAATQIGATKAQVEVGKHRRRQYEWLSAQHVSYDGIVGVARCF